MPTRYAVTGVDVKSTKRSAAHKSDYGKWVRDNYPDHYIVSVSPFDTAGNFSFEPLKARGYQFSGAGSDHIEKGILAGKKHWFKAFDSEDSAYAEAELLTEQGI